jgi:hypothetical protein
MRNLWFLCGVLFIAVMSSSASAQVAVPQPAAPPVPLVGTSPNERRRNTPVSRRELTPLEETVLHEERRRRFVDPIYRKPTSQELETVAVDPVLENEWRPLLSGESTGITRLLAADCETDTHVVSVTGECLLRTMPGTGSSFSFRRRTYVLERLADLTFRNGRLEYTGELAQGGIVLLPMGTGFSALSGQPEYRALAASRPALTKQAAGHALELNGVPALLSLRPVKGQVFVLRSVAYRGSVKRAAGGVTYNELDHDRRRDVTVAISIVDVQPNDVTFVWKVLTDSTAPKLQ